MAAVPTTFSGILYNKKNKTAELVYLVGVQFIPGLHPDNSPPAGQDPPLGFWGGSLGDYIDAGLPETPAPPEQIPSPPDATKPPPPDGGWGWHPEYGWGYFPGAGGKPHPGK